MPRLFHMYYPLKTHLDVFQLFYPQLCIFSLSLYLSWKTFGVLGIFTFVLALSIIAKHLFIVLCIVLQAMSWRAVHRLDCLEYAMEVVVVVVVVG